MQDPEIMYTISTFWSIVGALDWLTGIVVPFLFLGASVSWFVSTKSRSAIAAVVGSTISVLSRTQLVLGEELGSVYFGHRQPLIGDNSFIWFVQNYGVNLGYTIIAAALFIHFGKSFTTHNNQVNKGSSHSTPGL